MTIDSYPKTEQLSGSALDVAYAEDAMFNLKRMLKQAGATLEAAKLAHDLDITSGLQELFDRQSKSQISSGDLIREARKIMVNSFNQSGLEEFDGAIAKLNSIKAGSLIGGTTGTLRAYVVHRVASDTLQPIATPMLRRTGSDDGTPFRLSLSVRVEGGEAVTIGASTHIGEAAVAEGLMRAIEQVGIVKNLDSSITCSSYIEMLSGIEGYEEEVSKFKNQLILDHTIQIDKDLQTIANAPFDPTVYVESLRNMLRQLHRLSPDAFESYLKHIPTFLSENRVLSNDRAKEIVTAIILARPPQSDDPNISLHEENVRQTNELIAEIARLRASRQ